jgi:23S rRNA (adenine2503-C2)-methyltransferase
MSQRRIEVISSQGLPDVAHVMVGRVDGRDDRILELVDGLDPAHPRSDKWIVNVSTQYGCPVGCPFCDAGYRYRGNVPAAVMIEQIRCVLERHPPQLARSCRKLKVHFARMGEPALNPAVLEVLELLPGLIPNPDLWGCVPTVAPQRAEAWFEGLLAVKRKHFHGRFQLQFSLNTTSVERRKQLTPYPHQPFEWVSAYGQRFYEPGDRRVVLNFALASGVPFDPDVVARHFEPGCFAVKLTPLNPTEQGRERGLDTVLSAASPAVMDRAVTRLHALGFDVVVSIGDPREDQVGSNCGQAVRRLMGERQAKVEDGGAERVDSAAR